ncbi:hypothetical protein EI94DRAFT_1727042 [Lactarius quietus]|nr:hypothetical protein EI94DRAFT_1727042 [Lactarius quietus]
MGIFRLFFNNQSHQLDTFLLITRGMDLASLRQLLNMLALRLRLYSRCWERGHLAGGAIGCSTNFTNSGIGPKNVLNMAGIQAELDRPGDGQHLQDHLLLYDTSADLASAIYSNEIDSLPANSPTFLSFINSATAT